MGNWGRGQVKTKGVLLLCLCAAMLLLAGFRQSAGESKGESGMKDALPLLSVLAQNAALPDSPLRLVLKWQGEYSNPSAAESFKAAGKLSADLGIGAATRTDEDGHMAYRSTAMLDPHTRISMFWSELEQGKSYAIVTLETTDLLKSEGVQGTAEQAGALMEQIGIAADWNASIQGIAREAGEPQEVLLHSEQSIAGQLPSLIAQESYEDATTYSRSYSAAELQRTVQSGPHSIALQAAVHKNDADGTNRITIGLPLITIEY